MRSVIAHMAIIAIERCGRSTLPARTRINRIKMMCPHLGWLIPKCEQLTSLTGFRPSVHLQILQTVGR
jgi:hypothetical protein